MYPRKFLHSPPDVINKDIPSSKPKGLDDIEWPFNPNVILHYVCGRVRLSKLERVAIEVPCRASDY